MFASRPLFISILLSTALLAACDDEAAGSVGAVVELVTARELARAEPAAVAEQLAAERRLRVDARVPPDAEQSHYVLLSGELAEAPATYAALKQRFGDRVVREVLLGGEDAARPVVFRKVAEGTYTVCVAVAPPASAEDRAVLERASAILEADGPQPLDGEKLQAAVAAAPAETGHEPKRTDRDARPIRCMRVDVDARPESRIAAFEPA